MKLPRFVPARFVLADRTASLCGLVCLIGLGGFLLWAAFVPMAEGVAAQGQVVVESNRKVIQHLEGGIVKTLHVKEGAQVEEGQKLLELEEVQAKSDREQSAQTVAALRGSLDRLEALSSGTNLIFRATDDLAVALELIDEIHTRETALYRQQRQALAANVGVLGARTSSLAGQARGKQQQIAAAQSELNLVRSKLTERRALLQERLIRRDSVDELERDAARLEGDLARLRAERSDSIGDAGEVRSEVGRTYADFRQQIASELVGTRNELANAEEKIRAANDVLARTIIYAPQSGKVLNLTVSTLGGVVRAGEDIMEIVPDSRTLIATLSISPNQRDAVAVGLPVRARLNIAKSWASPEMEGVVEDVSGDIKTVPETGATFYEARVKLAPPPELTGSIEILPGMPIEANINSGAKRTFLSYLIEPITTVIYRAF